MGYYASDSDKFDWPLNTLPLTAPAANYVSSSGGNGVYNVGGPGFPTHTYDGTSYGVDVIFDTTQPPGAPPAVTSVTPYAGSVKQPGLDHRHRDIHQADPVRARHRFKCKAQVAAPFLAP